MSRWRELIMDFGQIFGTEKSYASSEVFSVRSDLSAKRTSDLQLRRTLEVHFRPLFQRFVYGGEKIACHDLKRLLSDDEYKDRLPEDKVQELEDLADFNKGKAISYSDFVRIVLGYNYMDDQQSVIDSETGLAPGEHESQRLMNAMNLVCRNTEPQEIVEERTSKYKCCPPPLFMIALTIAQIVTFILVSDDNDVTTEALRGVDLDSKIMYLPTKRREAWRFLTYCLVHQGYVDLIFNVILQLVVGIPLEITFSWWRMAVVYIVGVIAGSCSHSIIDHYTGLAGAGGGAYAILGANLFNIVWHWRSFNNNQRDSRRIRFWCSATFRIVAILLVVIPQLTLAVYRRFFLDEVPLRIGIAHYLGGLMIGVGFSEVFLADHRRKPWQGGILLGCVFSMLILIGSAILINIVWDDYPAEV